MKVVFLGTASCFPTPSRSVIYVYFRCFVSVFRIYIAFNTNRVGFRHFALVWVRMQVWLRCQDPDQCQACCRLKVEFLHFFLSLSSEFEQVCIRFKTYCTPVGLGAVLQVRDPVLFTPRDPYARCYFGIPDPTHIFLELRKKIRL